MASPANTSSGDTHANKYAAICAAEAVRCMIFKHVGANKMHLKIRLLFNATWAAETLYTGLLLPLVADSQITNCASKKVISDGEQLG